MLKNISYLLLLLSLTTSYSQNADIDLLREINLNRNQSLDGTMKFLSDTDAYISLGTPAVIYTIGLLEKNQNIKKQGIYIGETIMVSTFITIATKYTIKRDRPFVTYPFLDKQSDGGNYTFPSGNTSVAFATATAISIANPKWYIIAPSFVWAGAVGYSRMHLGVHYPSDVLAGAIVGSGSAYLTYKINKWINKKQENK